VTEHIYNVHLLVRCLLCNQTC